MPALDTTTATAILDGLSCTRAGCACQTSRKRGSGVTHCPAHDDRNPGLNVSVVSGKVLVHCHAHCPQEDVIARLRERGLWSEPKSPATPIGYDYRAADGTLLYQVVRKPDKKFAQRRPDGNGGWTWSLNGTQRVLYRLPELAKASDRAVFVCEGEKDADRLTNLGLIATTNSGGAGKWQPEFAESLRGRTVYILPDNDQPGREHAQAVAQSLHSVAAEVRVVELPGLADKGDVSDWLDQGHSLDELKALVRESSVWTAPKEPVLPAGVRKVGRARIYNLGLYRPELEGEIDWQVKDWLVRGEIHLFVAPEKMGKSTQQWRRIEATSRGGDYLGAAARKGRVLAVTEMAPGTLFSVLEDDEIDPDWDQVEVLFLDEMPAEERLGAITDVVHESKPDYLALDPLDECMGLDEKAIFNPAQTSTAFDQLRQWSRLGITIEALYHLNNAGNIANSYKFRSKPDHIYRLKGNDPADFKVEYRGRLRAIPRARRIHGNGSDGYQVTTLEVGQPGRPAKTRQLIGGYLAQMTVPQSVSEVAKGTGLKWDATKKGLERGCKTGDFRHHEGSGYTLATSDESSRPLYPPEFRPVLSFRTDEIPPNEIDRISSGHDSTLKRPDETISSGDDRYEICPVCEHLKIPTQDGLVCPTGCPIDV